MVDELKRKKEIMKLKELEQQLEIQNEQEIEKSIEKDFDQRVTLLKDNTKY